MRLFAAAMAALFALGMFSVGSTVSARSIQVPARASVQAPYVTHATTVAEKKTAKERNQKAIATAGCSLQIGQPSGTALAKLSKPHRHKVRISVNPITQTGPKAITCFGRIGSP
jgi:hypothetical protein